MKSNKWLDGKQQSYWPLQEHIGWAVATAGWVNLDMEPQSVMFNTGFKRMLPPGTPMILKHIDQFGYAYTYNDNGVMVMPQELLEPWRR